MTLAFPVLLFRARPSTKVAKLHDATDVTSTRKPEAPPTHSTSTSTKTTPSVVASTGVTIAATPPPIPVVELVTRVNCPPAAKPQPTAQAEYTMTSTSKAPPPEATKEPADPASDLAVDYSRLRVGENKSFTEAWDDALKWNEEAARVKGEEFASLMGLKMTHVVSPSLYPL